MRARILIAAAVVVALVGVGLLARLWFAPEPATQTFAGTYSPESQLVVRNLTILGGHVDVSYSFDVLYDPEVPGTLRCGLVDTSGTFDFFQDTRRDVPSGQWSHVEYSGSFNLGELTLGIRCSPSSDGVMTAVFRDVTLASSAVG